MRRCGCFLRYRLSLLIFNSQFGWLLAYWNFAGVPFSYAYGAIYMATHDPATYRYPTWFMAMLFVILTVSHCLYVSRFASPRPPF
jgi:hypothetical protein